MKIYKDLETYVINFVKFDIQKGCREQRAKSLMIFKSKDFSVRINDTKLNNFLVSFNTNKPNDLVFLFSQSYIIISLNAINLLFSLSSLDIIQKSHIQYSLQTKYCTVKINVKSFRKSTVNFTGNILPLNFTL